MNWKRYSWLFVVAVAWMWGCSTGSSKKAAADVSSEVSVSSDVSSDITIQEIRSDLKVDSTADTMSDTQADVSAIPETRTYTFKGMGGASMGAAALTFHVRNPGYLDMIAAQGGYVNFHYLQDFFLRIIFGGFCEMEAILEHVDDLNNPDIPELQCGPVPPKNPWENEAGFNDWFYDNNGVSTHRDFMIDAVQGMFCGFGNMAYYNPDHSYLPPGVPMSWVEPGNNIEKCNNPVHVGKPHNYNKEYNPDGEYDLITFCDGEEPVEGGSDNPDFWNLMGEYDPAFEHYRPVHVLLAVDYNGNGKRDYHEPVVVNAMERFQDFGVDGCEDANEDGSGGCDGDGRSDDPNGDNFHMVDNSFGTEGNALWDDGESYEDFGLDGVDGTGDHGENDGEYSINPRLKSVLETTALPYIDSAPLQDLYDVDLIMDGGIRDALHALTATYPIYSHLAARVPDTQVYEDFTQFDTSLFKYGEPTLLLMLLGTVDWSASAIGKNFIVKYGNPDATEEEIKEGDGKHVGNTFDVVNRLAMMFLVPLMRWPDLDWDPCVGHTGKVVYKSFYSEAQKNRYYYAISLPPCYAIPEYEDVSFPVYIYLPGHGMDAKTTAAAGVAFNILAEKGDLPKFVFVVPEGQCCHIDMTTLTRYCACEKNEENSDLRDCIDPQCKGEDEDCDVVQIHKNDMEQECYEGHFFANHFSNKFGDMELAKTMQFEDLLIDLIEHLEANYRLRQPEVHPVY
jgi:hypothetical protein